MNIVFKSIVIAGLAVCGVPVYVAASDMAYVHEGAVGADLAGRVSNLVKVLCAEEVDFSEKTLEGIRLFMTEQFGAFNQLCRLGNLYRRDCCRAAFAERYGVLMETCITKFDKALARAEELGIVCFRSAEGLGGRAARAEELAMDNKEIVFCLQANTRIQLLYVYFYVYSFASPFILRIAEAIWFLKESLKLNTNTGLLGRGKKLELAQRYIKRCCDAPEVGRDRVIADLQGKFELDYLLAALPDVIALPGGGGVAVPMDLG
jgi:hypothetical protein